VRARLNRVVATDNLVTSRTVRADQVRIEPLNGVPDALAPAQSLEQVVGKTLLHPVRSGTTLSLDDISTAVFIRRGDKVDVDFQTPVVHLRFEAAAETDGHFGDRISLRNLQSRKIFVAEVSGRDQARVAPSTEDQAARAAEKNDKEAVDVEANGSGALVRAPRDPCDGGAKEAEGCQ
jgi:flagella basal body P-ring formation protein FlgA